MNYLESTRVGVGDALEATDEDPQNCGGEVHAEVRKLIEANPTYSRPIAAGLLCAGRAIAGTGPPYAYIMGGLCLIPDTSSTVAVSQKATVRMPRGAG